MENWERVQKPPYRRGYDYPSFSSTLLDSIYRSIDDETDREKTQDNLHRGVPDPRKKQSTIIDDKWTAAVSEKPVARRNRDRGAPDPSHSLSSSKKCNAPVNEKAVTRLQLFHSTTSSSSECSSYGGFSSSEAESAAVHSNRLKPIRTAAYPARTERIRSDSRPPPPPPPEKVKKNLSSIRSKFRDLRKSRSPASPGARLASFLNSIFTAAAGNPKPPKVSGAGRGGEESACSTASSYSRSCLIKTPSLAADNGVKRSVRFELPADVGQREEIRYGRRTAAAEMAAVGRRESKKMMWRGYEVEEEDDDVASDSSSDLFELENLTAVGRYQDELPVYETTNFGMNRAIAKGLVL